MKWVVQEVSGGEENGKSRAIVFPIIVVNWVIKFYFFVANKSAADYFGRSKFYENAILL